MEQIDNLIYDLKDKILKEERWAYLGSSDSKILVKELTHIIERLENIKKIITHGKESIH